MTIRPVNKSFCEILNRLIRLEMLFLFNSALIVCMETWDGW